MINLSELSLLFKLGVKKYTDFQNMQLACVKKEDIFEKYTIAKNLEKSGLKDFLQQPEAMKKALRAKMSALIKDENDAWFEYRNAAKAHGNTQSLIEDGANHTIFTKKPFSVPDKYKVIAIRANVEAYIPQGEVNCWKRLGGIVKIGGEFGLFAVPVGRFQRFDDYVRIYDYSDSEINPFKKLDKYNTFGDFSGPSNSFCILEVDLRSQGRSEMPDEIEFRKCNVLFIGDRDKFIIEVKRYVDLQEHLEICDNIQGNPIGFPPLGKLFKDSYQGYRP